MKFNAPFRLDQTIVLNLTSAQANGNLGNLAGNPQIPIQGIVVKGAHLRSINPIPSNTYTDFSSIRETSNGVFNAGLQVDVYDDTVTNVKSHSAAPTPDGCRLSTLDSGLGDIAGVYNNGAAGVGATFIVGIGSLPLTYDNATPMGDGETIAISGQNDQSQNGFYTYDLASTTLTRSLGNDTPAGLNDYGYFSAANSNLGDSRNIFITALPNAIGIGHNILYRSLGTPVYLNTLNHKAFHANIVTPFYTNTMSTPVFLMTSYNPASGVRPSFGTATVDAYLNCFPV